MTFDGSISNPPYTNSDGTKVYPDFIEEMANFTDGLWTAIVPGGWACGTSIAPKFRRNVVNDNIDVEDVSFVSDSNSGFVGVTTGSGYSVVTGGSNRSWFGINGNEVSRLKLQKLDVIPRLASAVEAAHAIQNSETEVLSDVQIFADRFGMGKVSGKSDIHGFKFKNEKGSGDVKVATSFGLKYVDRALLSNDLQSTWSVATPKLAGFPFPGFGNYSFVLPPDVIHSDSYVSFPVASEFEAKNLLSYLSTEFAKAMVISRQPHFCMTVTSFSWIPLVDLSRPWSDDTLLDGLPTAGLSGSVIKAVVESLT